MQKLKNRKRIAILLCVFMLTFIVGAAFAADQGELDIIGLAATSPELRVIWTDTETSLAAELSTHAATIDSSEKLIEWAIGFIEEGQAVLTATATNVGLVDAYIAAASITSSLDDFVDVSGLSYVIDDSSFLGPLLVGDDAELVVTMTWDGEFEDSSSFAAFGALDLLDDYEVFLGAFVVNIVYERLP
ncbi:MAG: hypothetical protein FWD05_07210 [Oscillospiraceae bacterium]|nr:hypothetical protein [Oscillospiraceae bacterium]